MKKTIKKTLIGSVAGDSLQSDYIRDYIITQYKKNNEILVLSEGAISEDVQEGDDLYISGEDTLSKMTTELQKAGIKVIGLNSNEIYRDENDEDEIFQLKNISREVSLAKLIRTEVHQKQDDFVFKGMSKNISEETSSISIVNVLHIVKWILEGKVTSNEYDIILPVHSETSDLVVLELSSNNLWSEEVVLKIYADILKLPDIAAVKISSLAPETFKKPSLSSSSGISSSPPSSSILISDNSDPDPSSKVGFEPLGQTADL